jgi:hypothetical protein
MNFIFILLRLWRDENISAIISHHLLCVYYYIFLSAFWTIWSKSFSLMYVEIYKFTFVQQKWVAITYLIVILMAFHIICLKRDYSNGRERERTKLTDKNLLLCVGLRQHHKLIRKWGWGRVLLWKSSVMWRLVGGFAKLKK